jgi:hypothetical protein
LWTKIFHTENLSPDDVRYRCKNQPKKLKPETRALQMVPFFGCGTVWSVWIGQKISSLIRDDKSRYPSTPATAELVTDPYRIGPTFPDNSKAYTGG